MGSREAVSDLPESFLSDRSAVAGLTRTRAVRAATPATQASHQARLMAFSFAREGAEYQPITHTDETAPAGDWDLKVARRSAAVLKRTAAQRRATLQRSSAKDGSDGSAVAQHEGAAQAVADL